MASLYKPNNTTYHLPDGRHRTPDGQRVTKDTPGAVKTVRPAPVWWGKYKAADGKFRKVPLCSDKTASKQMLAKLITDAKLAQHGLGDAFEEHRKRPLAEHLDDYRRSQEAKGDCAEHVRETQARIKTILDGCRFVFAPDLEATRVADFLHDLRRDPPLPPLPPGQEWFRLNEVAAVLRTSAGNVSSLVRRWRLEAQGNGKARRFPQATVEALQDRLCRGMGISTSNGYLIALKGFTHWLVKNGRLAADPLANLARLNAQTDVRRERRALPEAQLRTLLAAADQSTSTYRGLTGRDRAMLYGLAMTTGYRAGELASLKPDAFDLDADPPAVTVDASYSKRRRRDTQPLPRDVADALRAYLADKPADFPVWPGTWPDKGAEMLRIDLESAGIPYRDEAGRVADFHALRHSYITLLAKCGVHPKVAQELARHSDIRLTMGTYTHTHLHDLAGAVEGLPALFGASPPEPLAATGTEACAPDRAWTKTMRIGAIS